MQIRGSHADSKALINPAVYGTAEAVPFVQSSLAGQRVVWTESFPQGLKSVCENSGRKGGVFGGYVRTYLFSSG
jgi:hypothetical protein